MDSYAELGLKIALVIFQEAEKNRRMDRLEKMLRDFSTDLNLTAIEIAAMRSKKS